MIKLNLTAGEADLIRTLLKEEQTRLKGEAEVHQFGHPAVQQAIAFDLKKVNELQSELLDAIMCAHPE